MKPEDFVGVQVLDYSTGPTHTLRVVYEKQESVSKDDFSDGWEVINNNTPVKKKEEWPTLRLELESTPVGRVHYKTFNTNGIIKDIIKGMEICGEKVEANNVQDPNSLVCQIVINASQIATKTRRGPGNFVIFPERLFNKLENRLSCTRAYDNEHKLIHGTIKVFKSPFLTDSIIIGYNGPGSSDCGLVLAKSGSKYQVVEPIGAERYYTVITRVR